MLRPHNQICRPTDPRAEINGLSDSREIFMYDSPRFPQTLSTQVKRNPRGRWAPQAPPRISALEPRGADIDPYGIGSQNTMSATVLKLGATQSLAFSQSEVGGPDLPGFRSLMSPFGPKAQKLNKQHANVATSTSQGVHDVVRKYTGGVDKYSTHGKSTDWGDRSMKLAFRTFPSRTQGIRGKDTLDTFQPGCKSLPFNRPFDKNR